MSKSSGVTSEASPYEKIVMAKLHRLVIGIATVGGTLVLIGAFAPTEVFANILLGTLLSGSTIVLSVLSFQEIKSRFRK